MKSNYPLVSVIMPCYNNEKYVTSALDSVLADNYPNKEIVIIDDGSGDSTPQLVEKWIARNKEKLTVKFVSRPNKGLCATLNELIEMAEGKYIAGLAGDDMFYGNTMGERVAFMEKNPHKKVMLSDAYVIDGNNNIVMQSVVTDYHKADKSQLVSDKGITKEIIRRPFFAGPAAMIRKDIYQEIGPYPELLKVEDWWFYMRAAAEKYIVFYDEKVAMYRIHDGNTSIGIESHLKILPDLIASLKMNLRHFRGIGRLYVAAKIIQLRKRRIVLRRKLRLTTKE